MSSQLPYIPHFRGQNVPGNLFWSSKDLKPIWLQILSDAFEFLGSETICKGLRITVALGVAVLQLKHFLALVF